MEDLIMYPVRHQTWLPSIFSDLFDDNFPVVPAKQFASPAVNIKESDKDFKIEIAAPGMTKEDLSVHVNNDEELVIDLEKKACKEPKEEKKENYLRFIPPELHPSGQHQPRRHQRGNAQRRAQHHPS